MMTRREELAEKLREMDVKIQIAKQARDPQRARELMKEKTRYVVESSLIDTGSYVAPIDGHPLACWRYILGFYAIVFAIIAAVKWMWR